MSELVKFIAEFEKDEGDCFAALCRRHGISRQTGYKWVARWKEQGSAGLAPRSRAPLTHPQAITQELEDEILAVRAQHRTWGPRKILAWLSRHRPGLERCAASTAGVLLSRHGLSVPRGRARPRATPSCSPLADCLEANRTWCADFKGWFVLGNGARCNPLTISDAHTRYVLRCQGLGSKTDFSRIQPLFEAAFDEFGLPERLRTDNGPPFATTGLGGLSHLSVWWMELGIVPERIRPGSPQENGRHERMHRTLKAETTQPPARSLRAQQMLFDQWREVFNGERPHEALGQQTPASLYTPSPRRLPPGPPPAWHYGDLIDEERMVRKGGQIKWTGREVNVSHALAGRRVGLRRLTDRYFHLCFRDLVLGLLDAREGRIIRPGKKLEAIVRELGIPP